MHQKMGSLKLLATLPGGVRRVAYMGSLLLGVERVDQTLDSALMYGTWRRNLRFLLLEHCPHQIGISRIQTFSLICCYHMKIYFSLGISESLFTTIGVDPK
jgi:hypothetical protein